MYLCCCLFLIVISDLASRSHSCMYIPLFRVDSDGDDYSTFAAKLLLSLSNNPVVYGIWYMV